MRPRRFYIETWGCQMNELDSQRLAGQLMQLGVLPSRTPEDADVILLNSCSVREKAEHKVYWTALPPRGRRVRIGRNGAILSSRFANPPRQWRKSLGAHS
jgi:hypothetical protein